MKSSRRTGPHSHLVLIETSANQRYLFKTNSSFPISMETMQEVALA